MGDILGNMKILIYDPHLKTVGGVPRFTATSASILSERYSVTLMCPKDVSVTEIGRFYGLSLDNVNIIPMPEADASISELTVDYDIFFNTSGSYWIKPQAKRNIFYCHFPLVHRWRRFDLNSFTRGVFGRDIPIAKGIELQTRYRSPNFFVDEYDKVLCLSYFTREWIWRRWRLKADVLYLFGDMSGSPVKKENVILNVSRFERDKCQHILLPAFKRLIKTGIRGWKLILCGYRYPGNEEYIRHILDSAAGLPVEFVFNPDVNILHNLYASSSIFWHLRGIDAPRLSPERMEHFGLVVVEAMQNGCVPIIFNGGGHPEIVMRSGEDGFLIQNQDELIECTVRLINDGELLRNISANVRRAVDVFSLDKFRERLYSAIL